MRPLGGVLDNRKWRDDCDKYRGRLLRGRYAHWCPNWDELVIDETCGEWPCGCARELITAIAAEELRALPGSGCACGGAGQCDACMEALGREVEQRPIGGYGFLAPKRETWGVCDVDHKAHVLFRDHVCKGWFS